MGVISKIREKSGIAVGIIAVGLILFILGEDIFKNFATGGTSENRVVGKINGRNIKLKEFKEAEARLLVAYGANGSLTDEQSKQVRDQVWNTFIQDEVLMPEFDKVGLGVSKAELTQMLQGDSIYMDAEMRQMGTDPQTKKFDKASLAQQLSGMQKNAPARWEFTKTALVKKRLNAKYNALIAQTTYITKAETKREYESQNTKTDLKFVFVPFTSIADSTLKVTDDELRSHMVKFKDRYKAPETRTIEYVKFPLSPTKEDSTAFIGELRELAKNFALSKEDSSFAARETEVAGKAGFQTVKDIPDGIFQEGKPLLKGGIYGPFLSGKNYMIVKVTDTKEDSTAFVRARHILFKAGASPAEKADARKRAQEVLDKIKGGEDFAKMAKIYGTDGTANDGGDLKWFGKGMMVKPFENISFSTPVGVQQLVETDFGVHIIEVTRPVTKTQYKLATIERPLLAGSNTETAVYNKALMFQDAIKKGSTIKAEIAKNPTLTSAIGKQLNSTATDLNEIKGAREVVKWSYKDETKVGEVASDIFKINEANMYLVAILTGKSAKNEADVEYFREQATTEVRKEMKKAKIMAKLGDGKGTLDEIAKKYGENITVQSIADATLGGYGIGSTGFNPASVGKSFSMKKGDRSSVFGDDSGVFVMEVTEKKPAAEIADYNTYKKQLFDKVLNVTKNNSYPALIDLYKIEDLRGKTF